MQHAFHDAVPISWSQLTPPSPLETAATVGRGVEVDPAGLEYLVGRQPGRAAARERSLAGPVGSASCHVVLANARWSARSSGRCTWRMTRTILLPDGGAERWAHHPNSHHGPSSTRGGSLAVGRRAATGSSMVLLGRSPNFGPGDANALSPLDDIRPSDVRTRPIYSLQVNSAFRNHVSLTRRQCAVN